MRHILRLNAAAVVDNFEPVPLQLQPQLAALRRKLDAVMQENHQHLAQTAIIAVQHIAILVHAARNLQLFLHAQLSAAAHSVVDNIHHIQRFLFNRKICILQTRQIKQIVNQALQKQALLIHLLMEFLHILLLSHHAVTQGLQTAADNRHRRAQLMRNIGDELTPQLLQLLTFLIRQLQAPCQLVQRACQLTDFVLLADIAACAVIALRQMLSDILHNIERLRKAPAEQHCQQHTQYRCDQKADEQNTQPLPHGLPQAFNRRMQHQHSLYLTVFTIHRLANRQHNTVKHRIIFL